MAQQLASKFATLKTPKFPWAHLKKRVRPAQNGSLVQPFQVTQVPVAGEVQADAQAERSPVMAGIQADIQADSSEGSTAGSEPSEPPWVPSEPVWVHDAPVPSPQGDNALDATGVAGWGEIEARPLTPPSALEDYQDYLSQLAEKSSTVLEGAQVYYAALQDEVSDVWQEFAGVESSQAPICGKGVVLSPFNSGMVGDHDHEDFPSSSLLSVKAGERMDIIVRDNEGWAYCRCSSPTPSSAKVGWLPAAYLTELASLIGDHAAGSGADILQVKKGDVVEVVSRHFSGWTLCREWRGKHSDTERREGWVSNAYLECGASEASLKIQWHSLVCEALERVVAGAEKFLGMLAESGPQPRTEDSEFLSHCLEITASLVGEYTQIAKAVKRREMHKTLRIGGKVTVARDVATEAPGPTELAVSKGDRLYILDAENPDWLYCQMSNTFLKGWVPCDALWDGEVPQPPGPPMSRPRDSVCAICLEVFDDGAKGPQFCTTLACGHTFHRRCLRPWLSHRKDCPLCRAPVGSTLTGMTIG